ncbi:MAG: lipase family protein [Cyclobacteriaceae bacterium]|nr:lipase family protein [Cyclobacteriaceae bacterium]
MSKIIFTSPRLLFSVIALAFIFVACNREPEPAPILYYAGSEKILNYEAADIKNIFSFGGLNDLATQVKYEIRVYKFRYYTVYDGERIEVSGLLSMPVTTDALPMVSLQHGTIATHRDAPSVNWGDYTQLCWFASLGYIIAIPDYIGFGESSDILHPYYHQGYTAGAVVDMLKGVEEFVDLEKMNFNGDLFLAGYSEGGYATMAAHKAIESENPEGFNLVASAPAAGGYDLFHMQSYFTSQDTYNEPFYIAYVAMAYKNVYGWSHPLTEIFNEPYASKIPELFDGLHSASQINGALTRNMNELFQPDFKNLFNSDPKFKDLREAFKENSLTDWVPQSKMLMYHGTADITVPYSNSESTYQHLLNGGASSETIELLPLDSATHYTGFYPYLLDVLKRFEALK